MSDTFKGIGAMVLACTVWGVSALYYKLLDDVPPLELLSHRTLWSLVFFLVILLVQGRIGVWIAVMSDRGNFRRMAIASLLIAANWFLFIFSIQIDQAMQASLGYYIFPLLSVLFGLVFFNETLKPVQWIAIGCAAAGVCVLVIAQGQVPWFALAIASSFGLYGVAKKGLEVGPVLSVTTEVLILAPVAAAILVWAGITGQAHFNTGVQTTALLIASGPLTAVPLILFSYATKRVHLSTVGVLQYLNPTLQFGCAVFILVEPFGRVQMYVFSMIWIAVALYSWGALRGSRGYVR